MDTSFIDSIIKRLNAISVGNTAELKHITESDKVSAKTISELEGSVAEANKSLTKIADSAVSSIVDLRTGSSQKIPSILGLLIPPTTPITAVTYTAADSALAQKSNAELASSIAAIMPKIAQLSSTVESKRAQLSQVTAAIAAAKAKLSPAEAAKLASMVKPSLSSITNQVSQKRAALDAKFVRKNAIPTGT